jgi:hypothetical protein
LGRRAGVSAFDLGRNMAWSEYQRTLATGGYAHYHFFCTMLSIRMDPLEPAA